MRKARTCVCVRQRVEPWAVSREVDGAVEEEIHQWIGVVSEHAFCFYTLMHFITYERNLLHIDALFDIWP